MVGWYKHGTHEVIQYHKFYNLVLSQECINLDFSVVSDI